MTTREEMRRCTKESLIGTIENLSKANEHWKQQATANKDACGQFELKADRLDRERTALHKENQALREAVDCLTRALNAIVVRR